MNLLKKSTYPILFIFLSILLIGCSQQEQQKATAESNDSQKQTDETIVGIIGPMKEEIEILHSDMEVKKAKDIAGMTFYEGTLKGQNIVLVQSGIGKVNAAMAAQLLVSHFNADKLINSGISGAIHPGVSLGDIVISTETVQHDMDETAKGYEPGVIPRLDKGYFKADKDLIALAEQATEKLPDKVDVFKGLIATGDQFIASAEKKQWIYETFNAYVVEMEGAAVGQVAYLNDVPYIVIRSASDDAGDEAVMKWEDFKQQAINNSSFIIENMLKNME
ncbi:5'-methylthioadenosine/adenosylhomocysteine nucleosidase [Halobacillus naozhouensis]|uniref:adenosylhomocysteine nucleosidase n=1 Tax=Halobacillus naozhouensis TaxID=554880 RepID=A0ABY8J0H9_9BACI|nr:5'-methylthioadenosine/adenosylhomocysteine nucleosidase [Halobacillus naozhouensis]WFT75102.1 5'-methylthioadenosine/adenosylhomocysteine nucleosidase [Halobacillus naozhouensis]